MPPINYQIDSRQLPDAIGLLRKRLIDQGFSCYVIGGAVRDLLLGRKPGDYDMATSARPDEMLEIFSEEEFKIVKDGMKHGTLGFVVEGQMYEITTFRSDGLYKDRRHPESVEFSRSLAVDVLRRDFTVNALAYAPDEGILDFCGGFSDLENGLIRAVGEPERRFCEDALRIIRAFRFCSVLGFRLESETEKAALRSAHLLRDIAAERISRELEKLLTGESFCSQWAMQQKLLRLLLPLDPALLKKNPLTLPEDLPEDFILRLAFLTCGEPRDELRSLGRQLRLSRKEISSLAAYGSSLCLRPDSSSLGLLRFCRETSAELETWIELAECRSECLGLGEDGYWQVLHAQAADIRSAGLPRSIDELAIGGRELRRLGFKSGPAVGEALEMLWEAAVSRKVKNEPRALMDYARRLK